MVERMQENQAWISMLRRIPVDLHEVLAMGLTTGAEIVIQKIVKLEPDFMIIRGRLAGTQDAGRVVLIPYSQLTFVAIQRDLKEAEVEAIFGKGAPPALADLLPSTVVDEAPPSEPTPIKDDTTANDPANASPAKKPEAASRTAMLAKLRERMKDAGK
jgi:hypothetical protein